MLLAKQFGMEYTDTDGQKKTPYIIHRTSLGCYERTLAYLIEEYAGALPTWMAPEQARIMTITERTNDYAWEVKKQLEALGIRVEVDDRNEKIGKKIREAQLEKVPFMLVVGDKEAENGQVAVRTRKGVDEGVMSVADFGKRIREEIDTKGRNV